MSEEKVIIMSIDDMMYDDRLLWGPIRFLLKEMKKCEYIFFDLNISRERRKRAFDDYEQLVYLAGTIFCTHPEYEKDFGEFTSRMWNFAEHFEKNGNAYADEEIMPIMKCIRLFIRIKKVFTPKSTREKMLHDFLAYSKVQK